MRLESSQPVIKRELSSVIEPHITLEQALETLYTVTEGAGVGPSLTARMTSRTLDMESAPLEEVLEDGAVMQPLLTSSCNKKITYRKSSSIKRPQMIVAPNFSWFLIGSRSIPTIPIFNFKPFLKSLYQYLQFGVENFCLTLVVYEMPEKILHQKD